MRIDVSQEVATCIRQLNGVVLDDVLKQPKFANADFWLPDANVVAELKCLTEDLFASSSFNKGIHALYASWVKRGLVPSPTAARLRVNLRDLPLKCAREFVDPIKRRLEASTIKKANRQIRETKKYLDKPDAKGLLLLVNDGNYMLPPTMIAPLLSRILKGQCSSINSVIYFSVNEKASVPGIDIPSLFWIDALVPEREPVSLEFRRAICAAWMAHYSSLVSEPIFEFDGSANPSLLDNIQFIKSNAGN